MRSIMEIEKEIDLTSQTYQRKMKTLHEEKKRAENNEIVTLRIFNDEYDLDISITGKFQEVKFIINHLETIYKEHGFYTEMIKPKEE